MKLEDVYNYQMALFMYDLSHKKNFHYLLPANLLMKFRVIVLQDNHCIFLPAILNLCENYLYIYFRKRGINGLT